MDIKQHQQLVNVIEMQAKEIQACQDNSKRVKLIKEIEHLIDLQSKQSRCLI